MACSLSVAMFHSSRVACGLSDAYQCSSGMWCRLVCQMCTSVRMDTAAVVVKVEAPHAASNLLGSKHTDNKHCNNESGKGLSFCY